eukprot:6207498-Pleurochrysis_carterae.AAC.3
MRVLAYCIGKCAASGVDQKSGAVSLARRSTRTDRSGLGERTGRGWRRRETGPCATLRRRARGEVTRISRGRRKARPHRNQDQRVLRAVEGRPANAHALVSRAGSLTHTLKNACPVLSPVDAFGADIETSRRVSAWLHDGGYDECLQMCACTRAPEELRHAGVQLEEAVALLASRHNVLHAHTGKKGSAIRDAV